MSIDFNDHGAGDGRERRGETSPIGHLIDKIKKELASPAKLWPAYANSKELKQRLVRALTTIRRIDPARIGLTRTRVGQLVDLAQTIADSDLAHDGGIMSAPNQYYGDRLGVEPATMTTIFRELRKAGMIEARNPTTNHRRSCHKTHRGNRDGRGYSLRPAVAMLEELERSARRLEQASLMLSATRFETKQILADCSALAAELGDTNAIPTLDELRRQIKDAYGARNIDSMSKILRAATALKANLLERMKSALEADGDIRKNSDETRADSRQHHTAIKPSFVKVSALRGGGSGEVPPLPSGTGPGWKRRAPVAGSDQMSCGLTRREAYVLFDTGRKYIPATDDHQDWVIAACDIGRALMINPRLMTKGFETLGIEQMLWALHIVNWRAAKGYIDRDPGAYFNGMLRKAQVNALNLDRTIWGIRTELGHRT